ncbi:hypothetical protein KCU67_g1079, partial [Aureobasidium melanogenum]
MYRATSTSSRARQTRSTSQVGQVRSSPVSVPVFARLSSPGMTAAEVLDSRFCAQPRDSDQEEEYHDTLRAAAAQEQQAQDHFWQRWSRQPTTQSELSEYRQDRHAAGLSPVPSPPSPVLSSSPSQKSHRPDTFSFVEEDDTKMSSPLAGVYPDASTHTNVAPGSNASRDLGEEDLDVVVSPGTALSDLDEDPITNVAPGSNALRDLGRDIFSGSNAQMQGVSRRRTTTPSQDVVEQPRAKRACVKPAYRELTRLSDSEDETVAKSPLTKGKSKAVPKAKAMPKGKGKGKGKGKAIVPDESDDDVFEPGVVQDLESEHSVESPVRGVRTRRATRSRGKSSTVSEPEDSDDVPLQVKGKKQGHIMHVPRVAPGVHVEISSLKFGPDQARQESRAHPGLSNGPDRNPSKNAWEYDCYPAPGYFTVVRSPSGSVSAINTGSLSLRAVLPQMLQTAYDLRRDAFPDEDNSWMEVFRPIEFSTIVIDGMTAKSVELMSEGKPWEHDELFSSLRDIEHARYQHGIYNIRVMQRDPDQSDSDSESDLLKLILHNYFGSSTMMTRGMMFTRATFHFDLASHRVEPNKALYKLMKSPNTRAELKAMSIISTDVFAAYGEIPVKLLEACFIDLCGGWLRNYSNALEHDSNRWTRISGDKMNLLPEAWLDKYRAYAEPSAKTCRDVMRSALQCRGLNNSSPIYEDHRHPDSPYLSMMHGVSVHLRPNKGQFGEYGYVTQMCKTARLFISDEQRKEMESLGYEHWIKGERDGTPTVLQLHVTADDDDRHWANTSSANPLFEDARKILLTATFESPVTGQEVVIYLRRSKNKTSDLERARVAMSLLEYANGTLKVGTDSGPHRMDFGDLDENNKKTLNDGDSIACPGAGCTYVHRSKKPMATHWKNNPDCETAYKALSTVEKYNFRFFICWNCMDTFGTLALMERHIKDPEYRGYDAACAAYFEQRFGDVKPSSETSARFG